MSPKIISTLLILCLQKSVNCECIPSKDLDTAYATYANLVVCLPSEEIQYPSSVAQLTDLVKNHAAWYNSATTEKERKRHRLRPIGALHAMTDSICTDGVPISLQGIKFMELGPGQDCATFGAGMSMEEVFEFLERHGRTLVHAVPYVFLSVAGSIANGAHGSSLLHPASTSDQIVRVTVMDATGAIRVVDDVEELKAFRVHLGQLGILVTVTFRTVPLFKATLHNTLHPAEKLKDVANWARNTDGLSLYWFVTLGEFMASNITHRPITTPGNWKHDPVAEQGELTALSSITLAEIGSQLKSPAFDKLVNTIGKNGLVRRKAVPLGSIPLDKPRDWRTNHGTGISWRIFTEECRLGDCPWDFHRMIDIAIVLDLNKLDDVVELIGNIAKDSKNDFIRLGDFVQIRFLKGSDALMSGTNGKDSISVDWYVPMRTSKDKSAQSIRSMATYKYLIDTLLTSFGGRPHWAKCAHCFLNADTFSNFHHTSRFVQVMKKMDPLGLFSNDFGSRLRTGWQNSSRSARVPPLYCEGDYPNVCNVIGNTCELPKFCSNSKFNVVTTCGESDSHWVCVGRLLKEIAVKGMRRLFTYG